MASFMYVLGSAPCFIRGFPFMGTNSIEGMLRTENIVDSVSSFSASILYTYSFPLYSLAISSRVGATILHGLHQSA